MAGPYESRLLEIICFGVTRNQTSTRENNTQLQGFSTKI